jgi:DNA polymerase-3 subunit delta'
MFKIDQSSFLSTKLVGLNMYFDEMVDLYDKNLFPNVLMLSGKKGIGKSTLAFHFLNYIFSKKEKIKYNKKDKIINTDSNFYISILKNTCTDVVFLQAEEGKNIRIDDIRNLKSVLSRSTLSDNPRFTIIDEVEFLNANSINALLKTLEEPNKNNFFILINNQQADLIKTISSRCLKNNIYLNVKQQENVNNYLVENKKLKPLIDYSNDLTPGLLIKYNDIFNKYKIDNNDNIKTNINELLYAYKKDKNKALINLSIHLINQFFYKQVKKDLNKIHFLLNLKSFIINKINDFVLYNLNINSVLSSIELKLNNVR